MGLEVYFILLFIGVLTFFFWKWVFRKFLKNPKKRKIAIWVSTIVGTPILYATLIWSIFAASAYYPHREFDSEKWKNETHTRYELTDDLISRKLLIDKSKKEVEQLLGKGVNFESNQWVYYVGFVPGMFSIDPYIIEITFKNNKVINVKQRST